jgi:hypothetical protein
MRPGHDAAEASLDSAPAPGDIASGKTPPPQGRRFDHRLHEKVSCLTCHDNREGRGAFKAIARQCQGCHHGNTATGSNCASCHTSAEIAPAKVRTERIAMSVWPAPRERQLTFEHARHEEVACASCHAANIRRTVEKTCASCHAEHHEAERQCTTCHTIATPTRIAEHRRPLHVTGCAGSGCHTSDATAKLEPARNVCIACHAPQKDHKPGQDCATCHLSDWKASAAAGGAR